MALLLMGPATGIAVAAEPLPDLPVSQEGFRFLAHAWTGARGPYRLLVDTGSTRTLLDPRVLEPLLRGGEATPSGEPPTPVLLPGHKASLRTVRIPNLRVGPKIWQDVPTLENDFAILSRMGSTAIDGIAGMDLFLGSRLVLDFPAARMAVEESGAPLPGVGFRFPLEPGTGGPRIRIEVAGRAFPVLLDSGYTGSLALPESIAPFVGRPVAANLLSLADRLVGSRTARASGDLTLAGITFRQPILELLPSGEGLLGLEVLRHFTVRIDIRAQIAHFQTKRTEPVTVPGIRSLGFAFSPTPAGLRIEAVLDESSGRNGLRRGDVLTHLDGEPAAQAWRERLPEWLNDGRSSIAARRQRDGRSQDLTLRIATLLE